MSIIKRLLWMWRTDRVGPDIPLTHWLLHSQRLGRWLCERKFARFEQGACMRPHTYAVCTSNISIGRNVVVRPGCMLFAGEDAHGKIVIEDDVLFSTGVKIYCDDHEFADPNLPIWRQGFRKTLPVTIKRGAWLGVGAVILPGVTVGENAVIGAGAVVNRSIPDRAVAVGVPARVVKRIGSDDMEKNLHD